MPTRLLFALVLTLAACRPEVGDECETSTDCSPSGDRLCDITQPGGYCTVFNCEPGSCPEEAVCVLFGKDLSPVDGCEDPLASGLYQRTFCLKKCENGSDCRGAPYACIDIEKENPDAVIVDPPSKVCLQPSTSGPVPPDRSSDLCTGTVTPPSDGAGGAGGEAGAAGG